MFVDETIFETKLIATIKKKQIEKRTKVSFFTNSQNNKEFCLIQA
jgi:hypothetical protein